jgi:hypothetical protein
MQDTTAYTGGRAANSTARIKINKTVSTISTLAYNQAIISLHYASSYCSSQTHPRGIPRSRRLRLTAWIMGTGPEIK